MTPDHRMTTLGGFEIHTLANAELSISMAPDLGGRIVSIHDKTSGREWLDGWQPESGRRLWRPADPSKYESGPGSGIDECLPTVLPCCIDGASIPDHGELWSSPATLAVPPAQAREFHCSWELRSLPLSFERQIKLHGKTLHFRYRIQNHADQPTPFQWAWHPLFTLKEGDQIRFHPTIDHCQSPDGTEFPWPQAHPDQDLSRAEVGDADPKCSKVFVGPLQAGNAEIHSPQSILRLKWTAEMFPWAGIWINRGAWKGLHHWAIEPTNLPADFLSEATPGAPLTTLAAHEVRKWTISIEIADH